MANNTHGGERISGILLAIPIADLSSISFEVLFMVTEIVLCRKSIVIVVLSISVVVLGAFSINSIIIVSWVVRGRREVGHLYVLRSR